MNLVKLLIFNAFFLCIITGFHISNVTSINRVVNFGNGNFKFTNSFMFPKHVVNWGDSENDTLVVNLTRKFNVLRNDKLLKINSFEYDCESELPDECHGGEVDYYLKGGNLVLIKHLEGRNEFFKETYYMFEQNELVMINCLCGFFQLTEVRIFIDDDEMIYCKKRSNQAYLDDITQNEELLQEEEFETYNGDCYLDEYLKNEKILLKLFQNQNFNQVFCDQQPIF